MGSEDGVNVGVDSGADDSGSDDSGSDDSGSDDVGSDDSGSDDELGSGASDSVGPVDGVRLSEGVGSVMLPDGRGNGVDPPLQPAITTEQIAAVTAIAAKRRALIPRPPGSRRGTVVRVQKSASDRRRRHHPSRVSCAAASALRSAR